MTLRLSDDEHAALRERADAQGISLQDAARQAVRAYIAQGAHRDRVVTEPVEFLDLDDLIDLARTLPGDPPPIRDRGLLGSAAARPQVTVFGDDAYPDIWSKAAALLHSVIKNCALVDGNKRLGWLATAVFLEINGIAVTPIRNDGVYDLVIVVASQPIEIEDLAARLRALAAEE